MGALNSTLPLQEMIAGVLHRATEKLAAEEKQNPFAAKSNTDKSKSDKTKSEKSEKSVTEKTAELTDPMYIEKLATAVEYIAGNPTIFAQPQTPLAQALEKLAAEGSPVGPGKGASALKVTKAIGGKQQYKKDKPAGEDAAEPETTTPTTTGGQKGGATQIKNDYDKAPGGNSSVNPTAAYPEKGPLVNLSKVATVREYYQWALQKSAEFPPAKADTDKSEKTTNKTDKTHATDKSEKTKTALSLTGLSALGGAVPGVVGGAALGGGIGALHGGQRDESGKPVSRGKAALKGMGIGALGGGALGAGAGALVGHKATQGIQSAMASPEAKKMMLERMSAMGHSPEQVGDALGRFGFKLASDQTKVADAFDTLDRARGRMSPEERKKDDAMQHKGNMRALKGLGVGALGGAGIGTLAGALSGERGGALAGGLGGGVAGLLPGAIGGALYHHYKGGKEHQDWVSEKAYGGKNKEAAEARAAILMKLAGEDVLKANISGGGSSNPLAGKGQLTTTTADQSSPRQPGDPTAGFGNQGRSHIQSNSAAINYTKKDAKGPQKSQLKEVLDEPALSAKHDSKLQENLRNTGAAGVKIAAAARAYLQKVAEEGCTCGNSGECDHCKLRAATAKSKTETSKTKTAQGNPMGGPLSASPGGGGGNPAASGGAPGMSPVAEAGEGADGCTCGGAGECKVCKLKAILAAAGQGDAKGAAPASPDQVPVKDM
jgi:hypothetical protein